MLMPRLPTHKNNNNNNSSGSGSGSSNNKAPGSNSTVAAHTKMRLLSKVEHNMRQQSHNQSQSIKKLITTAATGNGVVGDVDGLLTPMRVKYLSSAGNYSVVKDSRPERNLWSRAEMIEMLNIMQQMNALELLNDRNVKSDHVFRQIEDVMISKGYVRKSSVQIWTKWKFLKSTYNTSKRQGTVPKVVPAEVYRVLCKMLSHNGDDDGSECGNSTHSLEDSLELSLQQTGAGSHGDSDAELGIAHPIFGFRLGPIKPEPTDTGYESVEHVENLAEAQLDAGYDQQSFDHLPFVVSVKHEAEMDVGNTPPPTAPASPSPPPSQSQSMFTSTPQSALRVASFAKDHMPQPTHGVLQIERPTPAQLSKATLPRSSANNFVHPTNKLMLPKLPPASSAPARRQLPLRLPRDISVQPTNRQSPNAMASDRDHILRLKPLPLRQSGYSLRPGRTLPNLDQSMSPPPSPLPPQLPNQSMPVPTLLTRAQPPMPRSEFAMYGNGGSATASTSRQALQSQLKARKRQLMGGLNHPPAVPIKMQRNLHVATAAKSPYARSYSKLEHESDEDAEEDGEFEAKNSKLAAETSRRQEELFAKELGQLANSLRETQKVMLQDFFAQQKEFARREHEFQMKQDTLIMRALRKQTNALLQTASDLMREVNEVEEVAKLEEKPALAEPLAEVATAPQLAEVRDQNDSLVEPEIELQIADSKVGQPQTELAEEEEEEGLSQLSNESDDSNLSKQLTTASEDNSSRSQTASVSQMI